MKTSDKVSEKIYILVYNWEPSPYEENSINRKYEL